MNTTSYTPYKAWNDFGSQEFAVIFFLAPNVGF